MARGVYKVTVGSERKGSYRSSTYTGAAGNAEIAVRKALRCAKKDGFVRPFVSLLECVGDKDF